MYRADKLAAAKAVKKVRYEDIAEATGLTRQTVADVCEGRVKDVRLSTLTAIGEFLGLTLHDLTEAETTAA